jgi:SHS2 domain-containing protein
MNHEVRTEIGHRLVPHSSDMIVEAWAPTRSGCLEELVRGVVETFADTHNATATREVPLEVGAALDDDVVVALIVDVCYLLDADGLVVVDVALEEADDGNFDGNFFVAPVDAVIPTGAVPKGVSRSDLQFAPDGVLWRGRVLIDV